MILTDQYPYNALTVIWNGQVRAIKVAMCVIVRHQYSGYTLNKKTTLISIHGTFYGVQPNIVLSAYKFSVQYLQILVFILWLNKTISGQEGFTRKVEMEQENL